MVTSRPSSWYVRQSEHIVVWGRGGGREVGGREGGAGPTKFHNKAGMGLSTGRGRRAHVRFRAETIFDFCCKKA